MGRWRASARRASPGRWYACADAQPVQCPCSTFTCQVCSVLNTHGLSDVQGTQEIDPSEITICQREDGRPWLLGSGSFGQVRLHSVCWACFTSAELTVNQ